MSSTNTESTPKFFAPEGTHILDSGRATASEQLAVTDVMAALGMIQAETGIGLSMFLGRAGTSENDRMASVHWLAGYTEKSVPRPVRKAVGREFPPCVLIIVRFAYHGHASSAADTTGCTKCAGKGLVKRVKVVEEGHYTVRLPQQTKDLRQLPSDFGVKRQMQEVGLMLCVKCHGTGKISKRCQCSGTGKILDRKKSEFQGVFVYKTCKCYKGHGLSRPKSLNAYRDILSELPGSPECT